MKPTPLRSRLVLSNLVVLLLGMSLAAALAWKSVEMLYLATQRENLLAQASLTAAALQGQPLPDASDSGYFQTTNVLPGIHTRLLGGQGGVIVKLPLSPVDNPVQAPPVEEGGYVSPGELSKRPEIAQAMQGEPAAAIRRVPAAANRRVLYAAAPILAIDGSLAGLVYLATPLPAAGLPTDLLVRVMLAILAATGLALIAGVLLARRIAQPVENIARAAVAVSAGDLNQLVPAESSIGELNNLGQAFNAMTTNLRQSDQAKTAFISDVTHELRTPLTVIKGTIETLEDGGLDDIDGRTPLLAAMQRETDRLIRLVNELLVLTRADAGTLNLHLQPLDLAELAQARCSQMAVLAEPRQVHFKVSVAESCALPCVLADPDRLAQVLDNLLDNALRYSPAGSTVTIAIHRQGEWCHCHVSDMGPGIPAQHLPFIFERFYRADASRNRHTGGTGLGLAIARALIQAQGGQISAESVEGTGATLRFTLPARSDCHTAA
jgi:two-component system sensor histidine kinase BaeS